MELKKYIINEYPSISIYDKTDEIELIFATSCYVIVFDENNKYCGVLNPYDFVQQKKRNANIKDYINIKETISITDSVYAVLIKLSSNNCFALPVEDAGKIIGVIEMVHLVHDLGTKIEGLTKEALVAKKTKDNFLVNLSHEIRTPLNAILGFMNIVNEIKSKNYNNNDEHFLELIEKSADRFLLIINDLIDLSLLNANVDIGIEKSTVNLTNLIIETKNYFSESHSGINSPEIIYSAPYHPVNIFSDGKKIKHILYHLLDNAIKFSQNKRIIFGYRVSISKKEHIEFFVINEACFFSKEEEKKLFDIFEKQNLINDELNFGLGIGLPLVKHLVKILKGNIKIKTTDKKIIFTVTIPSQL